MKRIPFLLIAIIAIVAIVGMSSFKDPVKRYLVKEESFVHQGKVTATIKYTYDAQGRMLTQQDDTFIIRMTYRGDTAIQQGRYRGLAARTTVFKLNSDGLIESDNTGKKFMYDKDGFMTAVIYANGSFQTTTIEDGNLINTSLVLDKRRTSTTCTFYPELDLRDIGQGIFGRRDMHLIKTLITTENGVSDTMWYTHRLDEQGRVLSETYIGPNKFDTTTIVCRYY